MPRTGAIFNHTISGRSRLEAHDTVGTYLHISIYLYARERRACFATVHGPWRAFTREYPMVMEDQSFV